MPCIWDFLQPSLWCTLWTNQCKQSGCCIPSISPIAAPAMVQEKYIVPYMGLTHDTYGWAIYFDTGFGKSIMSPVRGDVPGTGHATTTITMCVCQPYENCPQMCQYQWSNCRKCGTEPNESRPVHLENVHYVCVPRDATPACSHRPTFVIIEQYGIRNLFCLKIQFVLLRSWVTQCLFSWTICCDSFVGNTPTWLNTAIHVLVYKCHHYDIRCDSFLW